MTFGEKLRVLRKEKGWSQDDLSERIHIDGRHISRYENNKFMPSAEVIVKVAETFNISINYLLFKDHPKSPLNYENKELIEKIKGFENMSERDNETLLNIIEAISAKNKLKSMVGEMN